MYLRLVKLWDTWRSSFWPVPALMTLASIALSFAAVALDHVVERETPGELAFVFAGGPEGARSLLLAVAGSVITVASVAFSVTMVAITMSSSQFGPRLARNFVRDVGNQVVLGTFIATFTYSLLVLRTIRGGEVASFVPQISVTIGILLALASVGMLIYFIHHIATSIGAASIIASVAQDLDVAVDRLLPDRSGGRGKESSELDGPDPDWDMEEASPVPAASTGYLQAIDEDGLLRLAGEGDLRLRVTTQAGQFLMEGSALCLAWPGDRVSPELIDNINKHFLVAAERSGRHDLEYAVDQLVEIAVRALSPGINDPFTAIACVDRLAAVLRRVIDRALPPARRIDASGMTRLVIVPQSFRGLTDAAFNQIRQNGSGHPAVTIRMLESIAVVAGLARHQEQREILLEHATMIRDASREHLRVDQDRDDLDRRYEAVLRAAGD